MVGLRLVEGVVVDCGRTRDVADARHSDVDMPAAFTNCELVTCKLNQRSGAGGRRVELAKQAVLFLSDTSREVKRVDVAAGAAVAELEVPQLVDHDAVAALVLERAKEGAGSRVVGVNAGIAFTKVADEERAAEDAESGGREVDAPGRIERAVVDAEGQVADAVGVEPADEPVADAFLVKPARADLGIGDVERAADGLNVEGVVSVSQRRRNRRVGEGEAGPGLQGRTTC